MMLGAIHDMIREWKRGMTVYQQLMFDRFWRMNGMNPLLLLKTNPWEVPTVDIDSVIHWNQPILAESLSDWLYEDIFTYVWILYHKEFTIKHPIDMNYRYLKGIKINNLDMTSIYIDDVFGDNDINTDWLKRKNK